MDEVTRGWRKLHNEELHNSPYSPNTTRMRQSRRTIWKGHAERKETINVASCEQGNEPLGSIKADNLSKHTISFSIRILLNRLPNSILTGITASFAARWPFETSSSNSGYRTHGCKLMFFNIVLIFQICTVAYLSK
jgi:hypothetical protein